MGVKYFQDVMAVSQNEQLIQESRAKWNRMLQTFVDHPQQATDILVQGGDFSSDQLESKVYSWV